jgi:ketosteroid isomerase-like protein
MSRSAFGENDAAVRREADGFTYRISSARQRRIVFVTLAIAISCVNLAQAKGSDVEEELLRLEKDFAQAIVKNDAEAIGQFLADDWIIIDADAGIIDRSRFLGVIKSGALTHELMESDDVGVRVYGATAVVTALTKTKGKFIGQDFTTQERATDVFVKQNGRWQCVFSQLTRFNKK